MNKFNNNSILTGLAVLVISLVFSLTGPVASFAATSPTLTGADTYSVLAGSVVTNTGNTTVAGDLGISPSIGVFPHYTAFPPGIVNAPGSIHDADVSAAAAQADNTAAFGFLDQVCDTTYAGVQDLALVSPLGPGVYCADAFTLTGHLALTGSGVWIFKSSATLITSPDSYVTGDEPCNVWWRVVSSATIDTNTSFIGNILASTAITMNGGATLNGRAFTQTAAVNLHNNAISGPTCAPPPETQQTQEPETCGTPGSSIQCATQEITCSLGRLSFHTPNAVTFDAQVASGNTQQSYDAATNDDNVLPSANLLSVTDMRSGNADNCPLGNKGFIVQASSTPLYNDNQTSTPIPNSNLHIITSNEIDPLIDCIRADGLEACYGAPEGTGNAYDVTAPVLYDDFARAISTVYAKFNQPDPYLYKAENDPGSTASKPQGNISIPQGLLNALDGTVDLLFTHTSHNQTIYTGVAVKALIPAGQDPGTYTGTITYTLSAQN